MRSPDSNDDTTARKYNVQIGEGKYIVIGDQAHVEYHLSPKPKPPLDLIAAEATYRQKVVDTYKWLNFSGFDRSDLSLANVPLEDVFVHLTLTVEKVIRESVPSAKSSQAEQGEGRQRERVTNGQEPIELGQALNNHLLIVGEPGAGKSTLLRWLAVTFAQGRQRELSRVGQSADSDRLPVLVELGHLPDCYLKPEGGETPNWLQFLPEYLTTQIAFTNTPPQLLTQALANSRCLLLFDGLDEVADRQARTRLTRSLVELARLFPGNRVIIGSRPAGVSESKNALRPQFQLCQIKRFTPEDVQRFFRFWYALDRSLTPEQQSDAADTLYARVQTTPAALQLANTPLLSTILVLIWRNEGDLPERRVDLYEHCCHTLIEHWEASHDVAYQGILSKIGWERHLRLLAPLAYSIHSQEQRTSASRTELIPVLARSLQVEGLCSNESAALLEAEQFLSTLSLRSGLLQYMGDDRYDFPHLTFQEYLAARYIAAQPDPDYIDLVMGHLHEAWWQEVHLLTIAHLGFGSAGAPKASVLILTILHTYTSPSWVLRSSRTSWLRLIGPGKLLPQMQLERRIAWILAREFELVIKGYAECVPDGTTAKVSTVLSAQAVTLVRRFIYDDCYNEEQDTLLTVICQSLQRQGNEAVVSVLLEALHDENPWVWKRAAMSLGRAGAGNQVVVSALLEALHDADLDIREHAAISLGWVGAGNQVVVSALLEALHDADLGIQWLAAISLGRVGAGNQVVVSALLEALHDTDSMVRRHAAESLGRVGAGNQVVVNSLLEALDDANPYVWKFAVESLGQVGVGNEAVASALLEMALHVTDSSVRESVAMSLRQVGAGNEVVVSALLEALHDADSSVRERAAESLGWVGAGNQVVVSALLEALHDADRHVRWSAAESLGQVGAGNEAAVSGLLEVLHDADRSVRWRAAMSLGRMEIKDTIQLRQLLVALNRHLYDENNDVRRVALGFIRQLLEGQPIPGYQWVSLRKRRARRLLLRRIAFWFGIIAVIVVIGLVATWLLSALDPNGFPVRFLAVCAGLVAFIAAIAQVLGRTLRDPWEHS